MSENLVVLDWHEGMAVPVPKDYVPRYVKLGGDLTIDEVRMYFICDAILAEQSRCRPVCSARPARSKDEPSRGGV